MFHLCLRQLGRLLVPAAVLLVAANDVAANTCASASNYWTDPAGSWQVNQASNGQINGQLETTALQNCPSGEFYTLTGSNAGNGSFTVNGTYNGSLSGCATSFQYTGTVTGIACTTANMSFTNSSNVTGSSTWTAVNCETPSGIANLQWINWLGSQALGRFSENPNNNVGFGVSYVDWGGRTVTETFPQPGTDSCWFSGSTYGQTTQGFFTGSAIVLDAGSNTYDDTMGIDNNDVGAIVYYRDKGRSPCSWTFHQVMVMACPTKNVSYATNTQIIGDGDLIFSLQKNSLLEIRNWGSPAPKDLIPEVVITTILQ
jgi:hypothetical protein